MRNSISAEIFDAVRKGDLRAVEALLANHNNLDLRDDRGRTPLMVATINGQLAIVKLLLERGANIQIKGGDGRTAEDLARDLKLEGAVSLLEGAKPAQNPDLALAAAISAGNASAIGAALDKGADINLKGEGYMTPLMLAVKREAAILKLLLERKAFPNAVNAHGESALDMVERFKDIGVSASDSEKANLLKLHGAVENANSVNSQLLKAVERNDGDVVAALLKRGADPNHFGGTDSLSVLMTAAQYGYEQIVSTLLLNQANANARTLRGDYQENLGKTALFFAAASGHSEIVKALLSNGANPNIQTQGGLTALMASVRAKGTPQTVKALLDGGADAAAVRADGGTALSDAINSKANQQIIDLLIGGGTNLKAAGGIEPLVLAAKVGYLSVAKRIFEVAAPSQSAKDAALLNAVFFRQNEVVTFLIEKGANPNVHDRSGQSAVVLALAGGNEVAIALLASGGATNLPPGFDPKTGAPSPPPDSGKMTRAAWRSMTAPYDASSSQFTRGLLSEAAFKKKFGIPEKTQRVGDEIYWYYRCSDGLLQVVIDAGATQAGVMIKGINEF